jgi:uncharacterized surface protein with fasciclin (FAS1) repeats
MENMSKLPLIIGIVAVVAVAGGALLYFNGMNNDDKQATSQTDSMSSTQPAAETPAPKTIVDVAAGDAMFSTLVTAVKAADLAATLSDTSKEYTVFAPTNDAFAKLPAGTVDTLLKPESKDTLAGILTYHVVAGKVMASDLSNGQVVKTVNGAELTVTIDGSTVTLTDAKGGVSTVTKTDIAADNGVIHVVDSVLMP